MKPPHLCRPEISTRIGEIGRKGRETRSRRPEISTRIGKIGRKGRETRSHRPEISTQKVKITEIGRESKSHRLEISTRIGKIGRKGRETCSRHPEISTQKAEKRRSFNKTKKRTGKSALIVKRQNPASYLGGKGLFKKQKICKKSTEHYTVQAYF